MALQYVLLTGILLASSPIAAHAEEAQPGEASDTPAEAAPDAKAEAAANDAKPEAVASEPAQAEEVKMTNAELVMKMQAAGYRIVNERGTQLFCKTEQELNSRLRKKTRCLTAAEAEQERRAAADAMADMSRQRINTASD